MKNDRIIVEVRLDKTIVRLPSMIRYIKREQEQQRCA